MFAADSFPQPQEFSAPPVRNRLQLAALVCSCRPPSRRRPECATSSPVEVAHTCPRAPCSPREAPFSIQISRNHDSEPSVDVRHRGHYDRHCLTEIREREPMKSRPAYRRQLFDRVIEMLLLIGIEAYVDAV